MDLLSPSFFTRQDEAISLGLQAKSRPTWECGGTEGIIQRGRRSGSKVDKHEEQGNHQGLKRVLLNRSVLLMSRHRVLCRAGKSGLPPALLSKCLRMSRSVNNMLGRRWMPSAVRDRSVMLRAKSESPSSHKPLLTHLSCPWSKRVWDNTSAIQ
jgi:hypothetical protein